MSKGGKGGDGGAAQAREDEQKRQQRIREGTTKINDTFDSQFNDDFFNTRQKSYLDYANPQLNDQYADAKKQLLFSLDRAHLTDSSVRAAKEADLTKLYDTNRRSVADQGLGFANTARNNIESARGDLINTLNATGDAEGASKSAVSRAGALSQADVYNPLGQLFTSFTSGLGQQAALEKAAALSGAYGSPTSAGLFGTRQGSVQNEKG
jgi:hypothetical protein